ncbi:CoA transferase [Microbacterium sp. X-17]|uniref:CaiB/BaiF CoA-transferase family protein n=1 Tax=Microbacterium sp. X-17 TaxID=3144404 RepID=UPI0031F583A3
MMRQALSDLTVWELTDDVAGSYCGKLFADLGATVTKIAASFPDLEEGVDARALSLSLNTSKRTAALRPDLDEDRAALRGLLAEADLVIDSPGPLSLAAWGLDADALREQNPRLTVVTVSGFGLDGPYRDLLHSDLIIQAMSGSMVGGDTGQPFRLPGRSSQFFVGSMAAVGALGAVIGAARSGLGSHVDIASREALATMPPYARDILRFQYARDRVRPDGEKVVARRSRGSVLPWALMPCADGFVSFLVMTPALPRMLDLLDSDDLRAALADEEAIYQPENQEIVDAVLYPWLLERTKDEVVRAAQAHRVTVTPLNTLQDVLDADHLHQRGFWQQIETPETGPVLVPGAPYRHTEGGWSLHPQPRPADRDPFLDTAGTDADGTEGDLPLAGVRVVDLTTVWAGPYGTMLLADLGAEVIRVENPLVFPSAGKGDAPRPTRLDATYGPAAPDQPDRPYNRCADNNAVSRNKLSCTIDFTEPEGLALLKRLIAGADVLVENIAANGLPKLGLVPEELRVQNPGLIVLRLPPTGLTGDWSSWRGFGPQFDALSGFASLCGHRGSSPMETRTTVYMDSATGPAGAFAVLSALRYRSRTGRGQVIELSQTENLINHLADQFVGFQLSGTEPELLGNRDPHRAPQGLYPCRDGRWLAVSVGDDAQWAALAGRLGSGLADDPELATAAGRMRQHDRLDALIAAWSADRDVDEAFGELQRAGVAAGPVQDAASFDADAGIAGRGWLRPLEVRDVGTHLHASHPYRGVPQAWRRGSPGLGEDNDYVYRTVMGLSEDEYRRALRNRIAAEDYVRSDGTAY